MWFFAFRTKKNDFPLQFSAIGAELPANIFLMSFEPWKEKSFLIRFEHIMDKDEDPQQLSLPVSFNVSYIFPGNFTFAEVSLGANQFIENVSRLRFRREGTVRRTEGKIMEKQAERQVDGAELIITMNPMEIRTFIMSPMVESRGSGTKSQVAVGIVVSIFVSINFLIN